MRFAKNFQDFLSDPRTSIGIQIAQGVPIGQAIMGGALQFAQIIFQAAPTNSTCVQFKTNTSFNNDSCQGYNYFDFRKIFLIEYFDFRKIFLIDFSKKFMQNVSNKIINNIKGINRVVYDVTSKPPSTIELE